MHHPWRNQVNVGASVRSTDGHRLGKVTHLAATGFSMQHGTLLPREYVVPYEEILDVRKGDIFVQRRRPNDASLEAASEAVRAESEPPPSLAARAARVAPIVPSPDDDPTQRMRRPVFDTDVDIDLDFDDAPKD